ncbi:unnamed protein product [Rhizopus stolonifer]
MDTLSLSHITQDDAFSKDLIRQFDKRRSRLRYELGLLSEEPSPDSSRQVSTAEPLDNIENKPMMEPPRSSTAKTLLSKSSAFIKSKLFFKRPTKVMMKTTICLQPQQNTLSTPSIPQPTIVYPPKPLVYSPVEPIEQEPTRLFHRLSMPLLKSNTSQHHRRNLYLTIRRNKLCFFHFILIVKKKKKLFAFFFKCCQKLTSKQMSTDTYKKYSDWGSAVTYQL